MQEENSNFSRLCSMKTCLLYDILTFNYLFCWIFSNCKVHWKERCFLYFLSGLRIFIMHSFRLNIKIPTYWGNWYTVFASILWIDLFHCLKDSIMFQGWWTNTHLTKAIHYSDCDGLTGREQIRLLQIFSFISHSYNGSSECCILLIIHIIRFILTW